MLQIHEIATALGVHPATVRKWVGEGKIAAVRRGLGGPYLVSAAEVRAFAAREGVHVFDDARLQEREGDE